MAGSFFIFIAPGFGSGSRKTKSLQDPCGSGSGSETIVKLILCQGCVENYSQEVWRKHSKSTFMLMYHTVRKSMLCFVFLRFKFLSKLTKVFIGN